MNMEGSFRPVRRTKRELPREAARELLKTARWGVLAMNGLEGYPYAIPVNFLYDGQAEKIYFHGARAGHKAEALRQCPKVCCTVGGEEVGKKEAWAPFVKSAVAFGRCRPLDSTPETMAQLKRMAMKYYPQERIADEEIAKAGGAVQIYVIEIDHLTGKEVQEK